MAIAAQTTATARPAARVKFGGLKKVRLIYRADTPAGSVPMVDLPRLGQLLGGPGYLSDEEVLAHRSLAEAVAARDARRIAAVVAKLPVRPKCIRVSFHDDRLQADVVKAGGPVLIGPDHPVVTSYTEVMRARNGAWRL